MGLIPSFIVQSVGVISDTSVILRQKQLRINETQLTLLE